MTFKEKFKKYYLVQQPTIKHGMMDNNRDYEIVFLQTKDDYQTEVQIIFKGCVRADYRLRISPDTFSIDDKLLSIEEDIETGYPGKFVWGTGHAILYTCLLTDKSDELENFEKLYKLKFYEITFRTNIYDLKIFFHDGDIRHLRRINKRKNDN